MRMIHYKLFNIVNVGTSENPVSVKSTIEKRMPYTEANVEVAKSEAYNGEYTIEDDGQPEPETEVSTDAVLNAMLGVM